MSRPFNYECPFCEAAVEVPADGIGSAVACPECGQTFKATTPSGRFIGSGDATTPAGESRRGGPEADILRAKPAVFRANPLRTVFVGLLIVGGPVFLFSGVGEFGFAGIVAFLVGLLMLVGSLLKAWSTELLVTDRRTVLTRGILSKSTSEVAHSDLRSIKCNQSLLERTFGYGDIALSSSGQDEMEIVADDIPNPQEVLDVIRSYR